MISAMYLATHLVLLKGKLVASEIEKGRASEYIIGDEDGDKPECSYVDDILDALVDMQEHVSYA